MALAAGLPLSFLLGLGFAEILVQHEHRAFLARDSVTTIHRGSLSNFCGHEREAAEGGEPHDGSG